MSDPERVAAVILAGGHGSRMGGADKGLIDYQGRPLVEWGLAALAPQVGEIVISANRNIERYAAYGYRVLPDTLPDYPGPLAASARRSGAAPVGRGTTGRRAAGDGGRRHAHPP